jgi:predicted TIM-barrel fold metal-dependent hydrolase
VSGQPLSPAQLALSDYHPRAQLRVPAHTVDHPRHPVVDAHNHLGRWLSEEWMCADVPALLALMDEAGVEAMVNLDGRWDAELEANLDRYDRSYPGRFATFCHVDWASLAHGGSAEELARSLARSADAGARGLKVWKDLGLGFEDEEGRLLLPDDPRLDPVWAAAAEHGLPVLIHVADPIAFFEPIDRFNERIEELAAHPDWSFHDARYPRFWRLMEALEAIVARHPATTFIGAHVGCCAEDLAWVDRMLRAYANFHVDTSARIAELGRQPRAAAALFAAHPDRILFGTDVFPPALSAFRLAYRFLETLDEHFSYMGDAEAVPTTWRWAISGLGLEDEVLQRVYTANARRLLAI